MTSRKDVDHSNRGRIHPIMSRISTVFRGSTSNRCRIDKRFLAGHPWRHAVCFPVSQRCREAESGSSFLCGDRRRKVRYKSNELLIKSIAGPRIFGGFVFLCRNATSFFRNSVIWELRQRRIPPHSPHGQPICVLS